MISYELAKDLKEAGYIFTEIPDLARERTTGAEIYIHQPFLSFGDGKWYWEPTLSELIEACGDKFRCLLRLDKVSPESHFDAFGFGQNEVCEGMTTEEAMAMLWLELNKKP